MELSFVLRYSMGNCFVTTLPSPRGTLANGRHVAFGQNGRPRPARRRFVLDFDFGNGGASVFIRPRGGCIRPGGVSSFARHSRHGARPLGNSVASQSNKTEPTIPIQSWHSKFKSWRWRRRRRSWWRFHCHNSVTCYTHIHTHTHSRTNNWQSVCLR